MRDIRVVRAMLEAKYNPGKPFSPPDLGDSPEPLTNYLDVSTAKGNCIYSVYASCYALARVFIVIHNYMANRLGSFQSCQLLSQ